MTTAIYFLAIIWLASTGSYNGWQVPIMFAINGYLSAITLIWGGWCLAKYGEKPLTRPLIVFWLVGVLISTLAGDPDSVARIFFYAILIAIYHLPHDIQGLRRAAYCAGWVIFPLATFWQWENGNSLTMIIWGLYWLGLGLGDGRNNLGFAVLAGVALISNQSEGGMLAVLAGAAAWAWLRWPQHRRRLVWALAPGLIIAWLVMLTIKINDFGSFWLRTEAYNVAWAGITRSPLIGHGLNTFDLMIGDWHAIDPHNLILSVLWETGLVGLLVSAWLVYRLIASHQFEPWSAAWLVTFASHSMVDLPLFASFFTAVILFVILGGLPCREKITLAWPWPRRWPRSWPARLLRYRLR